MRERFCQPWSQVTSGWLTIRTNKTWTPQQRDALQHVTDTLYGSLRESITNEIPRSLVNMLLYGQETKP